MSTEPRVSLENHQVLAPNHTEHSQRLHITDAFATPGEGRAGRKVTGPSPQALEQAPCLSFAFGATGGDAQRLLLALCSSGTTPDSYLRIFLGRVEGPFGVLGVEPRSAVCEMAPSTL